MTKEQFAKILANMFEQAKINCEVPAEKQMDIIWKIIKKALFYHTKVANDLFHLLYNLYSKYNQTYLLFDEQSYKDALQYDCSNILLKKANEYATDDRLHNFRLASKKLDVAMDLVCVMFMVKHIASIDDIVHKRINMSDMLIKEKFVDAINYSILLKAIEEENNERNKV